MRRGRGPGDGPPPVGRRDPPARRGRAADGDGRDRRRGPNRGQTTLDFAIGISVFLVAVTFTMAFIPGMLQPFSGTGNENAVTANRVATSLAEGTLADPDEPYILEKACTVAFFAAENTDGDVNGQDVNDSNDGDGVQMFDIENTPVWPGNCNFELDDHIDVRMGTQGFPAGTGPRLQIELRGDINDDGTDDTLCLDASAGPDTSEPEEADPIIEAGDPYSGTCDVTSGANDVLLRAGNKPPTGTGSVTVARRVVSVGGHDASLYVRVW